MSDIKVFKLFGSVHIIHNGIRKIIKDDEICTKSNDEILKIYMEGGEKYE